MDVFVSKLAPLVKPYRLKILRARVFPGCPVIKTPHCNAGASGEIPGQGTKIPHANKASHSSPCPSGHFVSARVECGYKFKI